MGGDGTGPIRGGVGEGGEWLLLARRWADTPPARKFYRRASVLDGEGSSNGRKKCMFQHNTYTMVCECDAMRFDKSGFVSQERKQSWLGAR